ncbi:hypothetical protein ARAM_006123 [Aspergillus rambellii]|uniref:SRR1-like domain-containing protein n=1 Tax=Aspergillus rambellii TaxID=308745 RepID=A0A0F8XCJ3_9EURO|nr:hypothetical protein ARAM_006123 [Aspergillus rambellii]
MPHSSRKKHPSQAQSHKRLEITDSSGWTHVTTGGNARRLLRHNHHQTTPRHDSEPQREPEKENQQLQPDSRAVLTPAEAPPNVTLEQLKRQLHTYRTRWEQSAAFTQVQQGLSRLGLHENNTGAFTEDGRIVCIGLGSPSGFLRGGWVDRRSVSMYQLAALASIMDWIEKHQSNRISVFAQDPVFNAHDISLLASLDITVLEHPVAFEKVSAQTLLFAPGAERTHLEQLLAHNPAVVFGGPLEEIESEVVKRFVQSRDSVQLPLFAEQEHAFWKMRVYYPRTEKGD